MSIRTLYDADQEYCVLYDSVTMTPFGPIIHENKEKGLSAEDMADEFLKFLGPSVHIMDCEDLKRRYSEFLKHAEDPRFYTDCENCGTRWSGECWETNEACSEECARDIAQDRHDCAMDAKYDEAREEAYSGGYESGELAHYQANWQKLK